MDHDLQSIVRRYKGNGLANQAFTSEQRAALSAIEGCRAGPFGDLLLACNDCPGTGTQPRSCGHRACNRCQYNSTQQWLDRQLQKHLPVNYFMATFTLPSELRGLARRHSKVVFDCLLRCAVETLQTFAKNKKGLEAELGLCAVLHTHTRRLDYHPHVHIVIPGGGICRKRRQWRKVRNKYLFNGRALAKVFRALFLKALAGAGIYPQTKVPEKWIAQCQKAGRGKEALQYLARYLYRGVISNCNIIEDDGENVTFRYQDSKTKTWQLRSLKGEVFIELILQHVLPKGFRRTRDYGFLHGNAKKLLLTVQWVLRVARPQQKKPEEKRVRFVCPHCRGAMSVIGVRPYRGPGRQ